MFKIIHRSILRVPRFRKLYVARYLNGASDPGTQVTTLTNGVRVATEQTDSSLVCISLFIEAGPRFETACNNGVTHFIERMAYKGFKTMKQTELENSLLRIGVKMTAETTRELQIFSGICIPESVPYVMNTLSRIFIDLELTDRAIELEKNNVYLEMIDADNNPKTVVFDYLHETAFQGTPLSHRVIGPTKNIERFNRNLITKFMCQHYQPFRFCVATSGCVTHQEMVKYTSMAFAHMELKPDHKPEQMPCRFTGSKIAYRDDSMPFAHAAIAFEVPGYCHEDYVSLLLMKNMVGAWDRSQGGGNNNGLPLARAAAHELCERYEAFYIPYKDVGLWGIYYVGKPMELDEMLYNIQNQWMNMCVTLVLKDVYRGVNLAQLDIARSVDGVVNSAYDIGLQIMYKSCRRSLQDTFNEIFLIEPSALRKICDKYLYDRCPAVAAVGPTENFPDYTRIRAGQYWLRL